MRRTRTGQATFARTGSAYLLARDIPAIATIGPKTRAALDRDFRRHLT